MVLKMRRWNITFDIYCPRTSMKPKLLICLILNCFLLKGFAGTFYVTSGNDVGPGSLKEILIQAQQNGSAITDTILFQLPYDPNSPPRIYTMGYLPLSSNLIIDATSQFGPRFGVTDAKVIIQSAFTSMCQRGFEGINCQNVQIFGLWIKDFNGFSISCLSAAIYLHNVSNFTIRGNVFTNNFLYSILHYVDINPADTSVADNILISKNFFGLDTSGNQYAPVTGGIQISNGKNITFGGPGIAEGNYLCALNGFSVSSRKELGNGEVTIVQNVVNLNYNRTQYIQGVGASLVVTGTTTGSQRSDYKVRIAFNTCGAAMNTIAVWHVNDDIIIEGNKVGGYGM